MRVWTKAGRSAFGSEVTTLTGDIPGDFGRQAGLKPENVVVPAWVPDVPEARNDMLDYFLAIQKWDTQLEEIPAIIERAGQLENTLIIVTSDNGMPFPRAKATLYDSGTRMPLAISWPARVPGDRIVDDLPSFADFAPTILEAAELRPRPAITGRSLLSLLVSTQSGRVDRKRDRIFSAMERHPPQCRPGNVAYPMRAVRTYEYLYIRNFEPDRGPAGVPEGDSYREIDNGPAKTFVLENKETEKWSKFFRISCGKRSAEELYDLRKDPAQLNNVAGDSGYAKTRKQMKALLEKRLADTGDPRMTGGPIIWDSLLALRPDPS